MYHSSLGSKGTKKKRGLRVDRLGEGGELVDDARVHCEVRERRLHGGRAGGLINQINLIKH